MTQATNRSRGHDLAHRLYSGRSEAEGSLRPTARRLPVLTGMTTRWEYIQPLENVLAAAAEILFESGRVFLHGNTIVLEVGEGANKGIWPVMTAHCAERAAAALLSNLFVCELPGKDSQSPSVQFPPSKTFVELLLNREPTVRRLPEIKCYAQRPVFDENLVFRGPGWHPDVGYLVHGPDVEPVMPGRWRTAESVPDRLPPRLRELLRDFCFKTEVDLVNAVGTLLTGLLVAIFVSRGKAVNLLDGNQPSIGKTLLALIMGIILDGRDVLPVPFTTDDEELSKRVCATLRGGPTSVVLIDNAKLPGGGVVNSPALEANTTAVQISLRILGQSVNYTRPNDLLWFLTMNSTKASPDLVSRGVPIRFYYEGDPKQREFEGRDPQGFARRHRTEILGELAGMVVHWTQQGRPSGRHRHRLTYWATVIGGILDANGLSGFLLNVDEAAAEFNTALDELAALAEAAIAMNSPMVRIMLDCDVPPGNHEDNTNDRID